MAERISPADEERSILARIQQATDRRTFLKVSGATVLAVGVVGCDPTDQLTHPTDNYGRGGDNQQSAPAVTLDLAGDTGILNYAYALEQLEAAFYTQVNASFYSGITSEEQQILTDLMYHEVIHRDFLKTALSSAALPALTPDFSAVNFTSRQSVLSTAQTFEDLGVAAYNGAGKYLTDVNNLLYAGKIVSVEARHAAAIRDLLDPKNNDGNDSTGFAGSAVVDSNGLDRAFEPSQVLPLAQPFIQNVITVTNPRS